MTQITSNEEKIKQFPNDVKAKMTMLIWDLNLTYGQNERLNKRK